MSSFIKNPITLWLAKLCIAKKLEWNNKHKKLKIGYMSYAKRSSFGLYNTLQDNVILIDSKIDDFTYIASGTSISKAKIGKFCSIGSSCKIGLGKHPTKDFVSTHPAFFSKQKKAQKTFSDKDYFQETQPITIGHDVWLGSNVIIVDGVNISSGAIVAAGSVVTKDIPPYAIVGGVPAKIIKYRFEKEDIEKLLSTKWWDFKIEFIQDNFKSFHDIKEYNEWLFKKIGMEQLANI